MAAYDTRFPISRERTQINTTVRSIRLNELGLLAGAVVIVCVLSILFLAQTGRVATSGSRLHDLQQEHVRLQHAGEQFEYRIAKASRLDVVGERAARLGLRPATGEQLRYATIELPAVPMVASTTER